MVVPDRQGESAGVGKARGFHQNPLQGVQPNNGLTVTQLLKPKTHGFLDVQRAQVRLDCVDRSFDAWVEEGGDFQPCVGLGK